MSVNDDDHQELDALETLSLTDFPLTDDGNYTLQDHDQHAGNLLSSPTEDLFEFCSGGGSGGFSEQHMMSHAEDMIAGGKLVPINDQPHQEPPPTVQKQPPHKKPINRRRSESMRELETPTNNRGNASKLVRNSHSLDYKKLNRNSKLNYESTAEMNRNSLSNKTSSSRWSEIVFGPLKLPPEMDLQDIRNRQIVQNTKDRLAVSRPAVGHHRKTSWGVLGILSCKSSGSVAVTMPLS